MRVIRVFPRQTSMTPSDDLVFIGDPPLWRPEAEQVHVSVTFTWDREEGQRLAEAWGQYYDVVRLGGPAFGSPCNGYQPGVYVRHGVTFTSRGCNEACPWCLVPIREGRLIELPDFAPGHIVQDNSLLQASRSHILAVFEMLRTQRRGAKFSGGFAPSLVSDWLCEELRGLRIKSVWLSADTAESLPILRRASQRLAFLGHRSNKLRCYVMIGYNGETIPEATARLEQVWEAGCIPFAQLYQPADHYITYPTEWKALVRTWCRPAAIRAIHRQEGSP